MNVVWWRLEKSIRCPETDITVSYALLNMGVASNGLESFVRAIVLFTVEPSLHPTLIIYLFYILGELTYLNVMVLAISFEMI